MSKNNTDKKDSKIKTKYNVSGLLQVFVVASIVYMVVLIWLGTDGYEAKLMTGPAAFYAALVTLKKFLK